MTARFVPLALALTVPLAAQPPRPDGPAPLALEVWPAALALDHGADTQRLVVVARCDDGTTRDVTGAAELRLAEPLAELAGDVLLPGADGTTELTVRWSGLEARVPLAVKGSATRPEVSFANDVIPTLTRQGCNQGSCHGAASGKNGFRLSLFGFDRARDHLALTRELRGRRIDPACPEQSLMLRKPTTRVAHKGGKRLEEGSAAWQTLRAWIAASAPSDLDRAPMVTALSLGPAQAVLAGPGQRQRLVVTARYSDGSDRDVTELALLSSSNDAAVALEGGTAVARAPGESSVLARFATHAVAAPVLVLPEGEAPAWPESAVAASWVDVPIFAKLRQLRLTPAEPCDDATFVRRVYLDMLSLLPAAEEAQRFLDDPAPDKRRRLVETLLERAELADVLALQWAEALQIEPFRLEPKGAQLYQQWLVERLRARVPFDRIVRELLTATGGHFQNPPAAFWVLERNPRQIAENVAQAFLGVRLQCAQCHNHPFERWTMDDYYGFAALLAGTATKRGEDPREQVVSVRPGTVKHPVTGATMAPKPLGGAPLTVQPGQDARALAADWLTAADNPYLAANVANRLWARFFGRGLVDPPDDVRVSNPASHEELHRALGQKLIEYGWDVRRLILDLCTSRTYQRGSHPEHPAAATFAGYVARRLTAEQALDAIGQVTGVPTKYRGLPLGAPATQLGGGRSGERFLELFGRPPRTSACTCDRRSEPSLGQVLHLIHGDTVLRKVRDGKGRLRRLLAGGASDAQILEDVWLAAYSRRPTQEERAELLAAVQAASKREQAWEDLLWSVINSKELLFQH